MYDAWAIFDEEAETVLLGKKFGTYTSTFSEDFSDSAIKQLKSKIHTLETF